MCCLRILEWSQHLEHPKCRSADQDLVGPGAHFPPNVSVPASKYLEHKWNLLVRKDAYAMPFFHYFRPVDDVFMCRFYSLCTVNIYALHSVLFLSWRHALILLLPWEYAFIHPFTFHINLENVLLLH